MNDLNNLEKGYISKSKILRYVSEEDIFELIFKFKPKEYEYVTSPFRDDTSPGCWFSRDYYTDKLRFIDFGNPNIINGVKMRNIDCFDAVMIYYKLPNFYKTLEFIYNNLILNKNLKPKEKISSSRHIDSKKEVRIEIDIRDFDIRDKNYWSRYGISKANLIEDKVFAFNRFFIFNSKYGDIIKRIDDIGYAYTDFPDNRKKLYRPLKKKKGKFISNLTKNDIGGYNKLQNSGNILIISKSYKDYRVLKNQGYNVIYFQNEGMLPDKKYLSDIGNRFMKIYIFFDNDEAGIIASNKVKTTINSIFFKGKSEAINLPIEYLSKYNVKDPSDMYRKIGKKHLINFLNETIRPI